MINNLKKIVFLLVAVCIISPATANSQSSYSKFFVDRFFDSNGRPELDATLVKTSSNLYIYIENSWWGAQSQEKKSAILDNLVNLSAEFQNNIYPKLTSEFGFERRPGIDGDTKITVLFHPMKRGSEIGYFRTDDGYEKLQVPTSNEREMVYISIDFLDSTKLKTILAHEFVHLITFNQKNVAYGVEEDTWLNEARAEFSTTIVGYNDQIESSNMQSRLKDFIESPSNSITEWRGDKYDYASVFLFINYLADHYGTKILSDSLKSKYIGIESINYALANNGYKEKFSDIFTDWVLTLMVNDCSIGPRYCYLNKNFEDIKIVPNINFLPVTGNASLSVIDYMKNWTGKWVKFIGGNGDLKLEFSGLGGLDFKVPYITLNTLGKYEIKKINLDVTQKGEIKISNFGKDYKSLIIAPFLGSSSPIVTGSEISYPFSYSVSMTEDNFVDEQAAIQKLLAQIESLKKQIADILAQRGQGGANFASCSIAGNLYYGISNNSDVRCLQEFLKNQGSSVYPEGLVTGNFYQLTYNAVVRFQEKYAFEILSPIGLTKGTGYVGPVTRQKINQIINGS